MKIETTLAQAGLCTDERTGAVSTPIHQSATFRHPGPGRSTGFDYSRTANPTREILEKTIASLEGGDRGFAFASGMAAITAILLLFRPGDQVIVSDDLYGGTYRLFERIFANFGIDALYVDTSDLGAFESALGPRTKAVFIETPTNPLMKITDLRAVAGITSRRDLLMIVDNTFMTPCFQRPIGCGADIVVHSGTKYLNGHNDVLCGFVVTAAPAVSEQIGFIQNATGGVLGPMDSWLVLRGMKTLSVRMERSEKNARTIARYLEGNPSVKQVYYPGLAGHPGADVLASQASGVGAMISFRVAGASEAKQVIARVKVISFAESLGGVESLITYPSLQTHGDIPEEVRNRIGVTPDLLRLSVGIEHVDDLIEDLDRALLI